jgi:hypothetical protein
MQRKQQVGECWVGVIFFACVCVGGASDLMTGSNDTYLVIVYVCSRNFLRGGGGGQDFPLLAT